MAGHSQFKNIMYRKGAQDQKRAKLFSRLIREITVAAKSGLPDAEHNPRLRAAVAEAKAGNMGKETIDRAIKRAAGGAASSPPKGRASWPTWPRPSPSSRTGPTAAKAPTKAS